MIKINLYKKLLSFDWEETFVSTQAFPNLSMLCVFIMVFMKTATHTTIFTPLLTFKTSGFCVTWHTSLCDMLKQTRVCRETKGTSLGLRRPTQMLVAKALFQIRGFKNLLWKILNSLWYQDPEILQHWVIVWFIQRKHNWGATNKLNSSLPHTSARLSSCAPLQFIQVCPQFIRGWKLAVDISKWFLLPQV